MRTAKVLILTQEEAREVLVKHFTDTVLNDKAHLMECIRDGKVDQLVPNMPLLSPLEVADQVGDLNLAEEWGVNAGVDQVYVDLNLTDNRLTCVWDVENVETERRASLRKQPTLEAVEEVVRDFLKDSDDNPEDPPSLEGLADQLSGLLPQDPFDEKVRVARAELMRRFGYNFGGVRLHDAKWILDVLLGLMP